MKKQPKPSVGDLVQAEGDGHRAGCRGAHAVAASWLADLVAALTGRHRIEVEKDLGYRENVGNEHFVKATEILRAHFRIVPVAPKKRAKAKRGGK